MKKNEASTTEEQYLRTNESPCCGRWTKTTIVMHTHLPQSIQLIRSMSAKVIIIADMSNYIRRILYFCKVTT